MAYYVPFQLPIVTPLAAAIPLPPSPFGSPYASPYGSPYGSPNAVIVPLPPSPNSPALHISPLLNPLPLPPVPHIPVDPAPVALTTDFLCHPLLAFDPYDPKLLWDVRRPPESIRTNKSVPRSLEQVGCLREHAMSPPWTFIRIKCDLLPWLIEYTNPAGIKVGDILNALYEFLREPVGHSEWGEESDEFRSRLLEAWKRRCALDGQINGRRFRLQEEQTGVRRVDWLLWDFEWLGLEYIGQKEAETWVA
ncbi:hypothetical protein Clacol_009488 [Clathrus columnatus]|uniref:DUF6699 domain-containing protein n=1 Tax=Clathrus columnatus TaxID=1419009 RepID=A0AAV5AKL9_9AGAM|nr:hypothetical protein Clacol_009488 [Clathrus columnatus]